KAENEKQPLKFPEAIDTITHQTWILHGFLQSAQFALAEPITATQCDHLLQLLEFKQTGRPQQVSTTHTSLPSTQSRLVVQSAADSQGLLSEAQPTPSVVRWQLHEGSGGYPHALLTPHPPGMQIGGRHTPSTQVLKVGH